MGVENITGKLNGDECTVTTEEEDDIMFSGDSSLEDLAGEEWSEANQFCFYFVKQLPFDDPEIKAKIDEADHEIYHCNSDRIHIANRLKSKRAERLYLLSKMENLISSFGEYNAIFEEKRREFETVQEDLQVWCLENEFDDEVKKEQEVVKVEINSLSERLREIKMEIELLDVQMICILEQRDKACEKIKILRIQRDKGNATYFQSRAVMSKAIELAASGNVRDLEELANSEVEKFMYHWNNEKAFRDDYTKRISLSLNGRIRSSEEKHVETKEGISMEKRKKTMEKKAIKLSSVESDSMDFDVRVKLEKEEIDEESLKEKKREEQLEKARLAMERKRKLQEKAAVKAAIRVQREAEKKLKEREKRAKKKKKAAFNSSPSGTTSETVTEASETEKTLLVFPKQRSFRYRRHGRAMETTSLSKVLNKRRKAYRLWIWTVTSIAFALTFLIIIFFYISLR